MRLAHSFALAVLACAASALPASATTLKVPSKYPTITAALAAAKNGDTVQVSPKSGADPTYHEALTISKSVILQGQNGATLDGTGLNTLFAAHDGIDIRADHVAVRALTVQNFTDADPTDVNTVTAISVGYNSDDFLTYFSNSDIEVSGCTIRANNQGIFFQTYAGNSPYYGGGGASLKGYKVLNNQITGNAGAGVTVTSYLSIGAPYTVDANGNSVPHADLGLQICGNKVAQNGFDGVDVDGDGATLTANEVATNYNIGVSVYASTFDPRVAGHPASSAVALNYVHDNGNYGVAAQGSLTVSGNAAARNTGRGISVTGADFGTVSFNSVTGTVLDYYGDAAGIYADYTGTLGRLTIGANQVGGNAGDGIFLYTVGGALVSGNYVTGNGGIGIHLSDEGALYGLPANTVTLNTAQRNTLFDAQDDIAALDGLATPNVWTRNNFGTTNPPGLSH